MLLSIKETAIHLGISVDTVHRRIKAGILEAHKQNGQWRVDVGGADAPSDAPADAPGPTQDTTAMLEALTAQLAMKDQQIERLHTLLMQSALAPAPAEQKPPWFMFWK